MEASEDDKTKKADKKRKRKKKGEASAASRKRSKKNNKKQDPTQALPSAPNDVLPAVQGDSNALVRSVVAALQQEDPNSGKADSDETVALSFESFIRTAINKLCRVETETTAGHLATQLVHRERTRCLAVREGQRPLNKPQVARLKSLIERNPETTRLTLQMWETTDTTTKQEIQEAEYGVNNEKFTFGTSGGNNYFAACMQAMEAKPALLKNQSLLYNEAHVYAFGNWLKLRTQGLFFSRVFSVF